MLHSFWNLPSHPKAPLLRAARSSATIAVSANQNGLCSLSLPLCNFCLMRSESDAIACTLRGRTAFYTLLPGAPSICVCVCGCLSSCPSQTGVGRDAVWCTPCSSTPVPRTLWVHAGAHKSFVERWWGPQACVTSKR